MQHSKIIAELAERLGGQVKLAGKLGVDETQISKWKLRGIPARYWPHVLAIARRRQFSLTLDAIASGSPLSKPSRAA